MPKSVTIQLLTAGEDTGPFNLLSDADNYNTTFEVNVPKNSLISGYTTDLVPDIATIIRVQSISELCSNYVDLNYPTTTTTTTTASPTTTTTTTAAPTTTTTTAGPCSLTLYFNTSAIPSPGGWDTQTEACEGTGTMLTVYTTGPTCPTTFNEVFNDGKALYTDSSLTTLLDGGDKWFKDTSSPNSGQAIQVGNDGFINQIGVCNPTTTTTTTTTTASPTTTTTAAPTTTTTTAAPTTTTTAAPTTTTTTTAAPTIYTHGAVRAICSDYCTANYNITTLTLADADYDALTIGDTIYGQGGVAGFVAYSNVSTDTATGPFRIAEIDSSGVVVSIKVCVGGSCVVL